MRSREPFAVGEGKERKDVRQVKVRTNAAACRLSEKMIAYFEQYDAQEGVPSFEKFAQTVSLDGKRELLSLAARFPVLSAAIARCRDVLRDRLTDAALLRRYDPSFCKYLLDALAAESGSGEDAEERIEVEVRVL